MENTQPTQGTTETYKEVVLEINRLKIEFLYMTIQNMDKLVSVVLKKPINEYLDRFSSAPIPEKYWSLFDTEDKLAEINSLIQELNIHYEFGVDVFVSNVTNSLIFFNSIGASEEEVEE